MLKKLWERIKNPHGLWLIPFYIFTAAVIVLAVLFGVVWQTENYSFLAYVFYGLAAIALAYTVYTIVKFVPVIRRKIIESLQKHEFTRKIYGHFGFRTIIFAIISLAISIINAVINGTIGIIYISVWYGALGAYYLLLAAMRGGVILYHGRKKKFEQIQSPEQIKIREIRTYRVCGILLVLLPFALSFAILEMMASGMAFVHSGMMIYVAAMYTFYKVVTSIINFFRARKSDEMTVRAIRNVNLADALVSLLALQTAMFHEFSQNESLGYSNAITGAVVCALTAAIGIFMIVISFIKVKAIKENTNERQ